MGKEYVSFPPSCGRRTILNRCGRFQDFSDPNLPTSGATMTTSDHSRNISVTIALPNMAPGIAEMMLLRLIRAASQVKPEEYLLQGKKRVRDSGGRENLFAA
jgi:hypothetical protein